ncbi:MAG TPA: class I SAM-dependent methyltransferase, partial [Roseiarcus sp.]|nr:class I SAM-dependent methyltransferase [Roseiarcus sp.]
MNLARRIFRSAALRKYLRRGLPREPYASFGAPADQHSSFRNDLEREFYGHQGRQIHKWGHYLEVYDRFFAPLKHAGRPVGLLELGVQHGGSLQLWRKYFGPSARIAGIDVDPRTEFESENIKVFIGSQADPATLDRAAQWLDALDIVIDDGSHVASHQSASLDHLFPLLSPGGFYICEDLHTSYWRSYEGGYRRRGAFIERIKRLIDDMHAWHH